MTVRVDPYIKIPTHHISLEDRNGNIIGLNIINDKGLVDPLAISENPVDRTAIKTFQGNQQYSDLEEPWSPIAQSSWEGGGLSEDYDNDTSRFLWNRRTNTTLDKVILGPRDTYTRGYRNMDFMLPGSLKWKRLYRDVAYIFTKVKASATYDAAFLYLHIKRSGEPKDDLHFEIRSDDGGNPGAILQTIDVTISDVPDIEAEFYRVDLTPQSLTANSYYWVGAWSEDGDEKNCWMVGTGGSGGNTKVSSGGATWSPASDYDLYYLMTDLTGNHTFKFFDYLYAKYLIRNPASGAPKIFINGDRGVAASNAGDMSKLMNATSKGWATDEFVGAVVMIISGPGFNEPENYRTIIANDDKDLTVDHPWLITHTSSTAYVIVGADTWREVTGHGLTAPVTSVLPINNLVYFAQGEDVNIRRMRWTTSTGYQWADDGTNKATCLCSVYDEIDGLTIWRGNNGDPVSVSKANTIPDWGTNITFASNINMKDHYGRITNMTAYGYPELPYIMREGMLMYISADKVIKIKMDELATVMDTNNGLCMASYNVYLVFNLGASTQFYYGSELTDVGLNREAGLPAGMTGVPNDMVVYPGKLYEAINARDGVSSIAVRCGDGWSELYRAPVAGERITAIGFQPVPGDRPDRLYAVVGENIISLCHPSNVDDPYHDVNYEFVHEGSLTTGYMYANMFDAVKLFKDIKIFAVGLEKDNVTVAVDYQIDDDNEWRELDDVFDEVPSKEVSIGEGGFGEMGKRIRLRIRLMTTDVKKTPAIKGTVVDAIYRIAVKYSYTFAARVEDAEINLRVERDSMNEFTEKTDLLDYWLRNLIPLKMRSIYKKYDNKMVFIDPYPSRPMKEKSESYYIKLLAVEL